MYYLIRDNNNGSFMVSKWENVGSYPVQVYTVRVPIKGKASCSCPSGHHRGYCKHTGIVKEWIKNGKIEFQEIIA